MQISGRGKIVVWQGGSLWLLAAQRDVADTDFHAHHAIQITIALQGGFLIRTPDRSASGPMAAVAADQRHNFKASGVAAFLFVEPESPAGRTVSARLFDDSSLKEIDAGPFATTLTALQTCFDIDGPSADFIKIGQALLAEIAGELIAPRPSNRVQAMIDFIRSSFDGPISLNAAADRAALSPSRARHLFAETTGLPFKTYVLWQRLERAVEFYAAGHSLTESAHAAGFSDSAHLSRTFRKTFGIPASLLELS